MSKFFDELFNKSDDDCNCLECRLGYGHSVETDILYADISIEDPSDIVFVYIEAIKQAESMEEIEEIMISLFVEGVRYGIKDYLLTELKTKIKQMHTMDIGYDDGA